MYFLVFLIDLKRVITKMFIYSIASLISLLNYYKNVPNGPIASENADINIIYVKTIFCRIILPWLTIPTYRML